MGDVGAGGGVPAGKRAEGREPMPLRLEQDKIYPASVRGTYRSIKWAILVVALAVYYLLPFLRWDRGPGRPDQAILFDFAGQRFHVLGLEIWPQEVYYVAGLMIVAAFVLFLMNAVAGRVWCGYLCPQTVWTDLFLAVERTIQGERRQQMKRDAGPWGFDRAWRKAATHAVWLAIALGTGGAFVLYFTDAPTLVGQLARFEAPSIAYVWIGILTTTTYLLAGFSREQVCLYMCPWPRIQAALTDEWALNVSYRVDRGEPRGSLKQNQKLREAGQPAGDCVDCGQCVAVCPTGVDIRAGLQMGCIQCGLCIDACDTVMAKLGQAPRLIAYDTDINIERRERGEAPIVRIVRPRTVFYVVLIVAVTVFIGWRLAVRPSFGFSVSHDRNPQAVVNSDGSVRNGYTLRLANMAAAPRVFTLEVGGLPQGGRVVSDHAADPTEDAPRFAVGPDQTREVRVQLSVPAEAVASTALTFRLVGPDGETIDTADFFKAP